MLRALIRFRLHAALLAVAVGIAAWAFVEMVRPENVLELMQVLSSC
jgi:hypothetical protein